MPLLPGHKPGPYEILAPAGAGGMGEVYRARDRAGNRVLAESSGRVLVGILESQNLRLFRVPLDGSPETEVPADPAHVSGYSHLSPASWNADGRLLASLHDSWFAAPAVLDTGNGHVHPLPADKNIDPFSMAWLLDGRIMALRIGNRSISWRFAPEREHAR